MIANKINQHRQSDGRFSDPKRINLRAYLSLLVICALSLMPSYAQARQNKGNVYAEKYGAFVMDSDTGLILYQANANKALHPASLTKLMTLLLVFDALDRGKLKLYSRVRISNHAASMVPSKLDLPPGSTIKVKDAILVLVTKSANDIAVALAEKLGGSEEGFADLMNKKAVEIGMTKTHFTNASGLNDPKQVSSARDMANLARFMITRYGHHYHYFSTASFTYQGKTYKSHNKLMESYPGMDGMKTGYIRPSGFNLVASAVQNDRRLIAVVFGGRTGKSRNAQMKILLDNAFDKINNLQIANQNVPVPRTKPEHIVKLASLEPSLQAVQSNTTQAEDQDTEIIDAATNRKSRWDMLDSSQENSMFNRMIGEGDYDVTVRNRIETGLIAISAHLQESIPDDSDNVDTPSIEMASNDLPNAIPANISKAGAWSIQIGAFTSRARVDTAISQSIDKLPDDLKHGNSTIAPLKTAQGWIYRGRLQGYTKDAAKDACRILNDCIPISPNAQ
tara:strand:- start:7870 stop:9390 length:1521 start_codon:yes stop_codon:yes gene_type:complete